MPGSSSTAGHSTSLTIISSSSKQQQRQQQQQQCVSPLLTFLCLIIARRLLAPLLPLRTVQFQQQQQQYLQRIGIVFANICSRDASQAAQKAATARCGSGCMLGLLARLPGAAEGKHLSQPELVKGAVTVLHQLSGSSLDSMWIVCLLLRFVRVWQGSCCCSCVVVAAIFSVAVCL